MITACFALLYKRMKILLYNPDNGVTRNFMGRHVYDADHPAWRRVPLARCRAARIAESVDRGRDRSVQLASNSDL